MPSRTRPLFLLPIALFAVAPASAHPGTDVAIADLTALIALTPDRAEPHLRRAACFVEHGRWAEASADLETAARLAPDDPGLPLAWAGYHLARRDGVAVVRALASAKGDPASLVVRARAHVLLGNRPAAAADFQSALALIPEPAPELWLEANALIDPPAAALAHLEAGLARLGPVPALEERSLALELDLGHPEAALARLARLAASAERPELFLKRRGDLLASLGRSAEARADYAAALAALDRLADWLRAAEPSRALAAQLAALSRVSPP